MNAIVLVDDLVKHIQEIIKEYDLTTKVEGFNKSPSVYAGYLPPKEDNNGELTPNDYPFVIVRFLTDDDNIDSEDMLAIRLVIGTHSEDDQNGWRDVVNVASRIKIGIMEKRIFGPFVLTGKIQTELFEEQLRPFWHGIMDLNFNAPQIQSEVEW
ncbi:hypothetical protein [Psychrobacillus sp. FSL K6-1267]|uniref:hypothetical protein n=1 Tax=Psychrobacillus sp. FSL K6-1267 TaxID=2921543 RepID=UPI0030FA28A4